ncbi:DUF1841 family protein [Ectothiorhodospira mobilis]|uniref:DUF1841 family protein n=1 Tax=Ectothiorhodospira mobilis TaxID=195064 RepID=UPI001907CF28|nr:DUF1841 family protein [Ectothiorhodospira mobilis]MBK1692261.1 hypothetical protein [Ectothiorhodospira mobilis]
MFADQGREQLRAMYCQAWRKWRAGEPLEPLERQIAELVREHPEYHGLLEDAGAARGAEFHIAEGVDNPFLHMGMHLALRDQVAMDRPAGIAAVHRALALRMGPHGAEHAMMECLGTALWEAQRQGGAPDEQAYLDCLKRL